MYLKKHLSLQKRIDLLQLLMDAQIEPHEEKQNGEEHDKEIMTQSKEAKRGMSDFL